MDEKLVKLQIKAKQNFKSYPQLSNSRITTYLIPVIIPDSIVKHSPFFVLIYIFLTYFREEGKGEVETSMM